MFFIHLSAHNAEKVYLCNMICSTFAWLWFLILALRFSFSLGFSPSALALALPPAFWLWPCALALRFGFGSASWLWSCVLALALRPGFSPLSLFEVVFTTSLPIPPQALVELSMLIIPINI